jgi:hypothetical protein
MSGNEGNEGNEEYSVDDGVVKRVVIILGQPGSGILSAAIQLKTRVSSALNESLGSRTSAGDSAECGLVIVDIHEESEASVLTSTWKKLKDSTAATVILTVITSPVRHFPIRDFVSGMSSMTGCYVVYTLAVISVPSITTLQDSKK